ncbi:MAG: hypothetical protein HOQ19_13670 [Gemmatimonadaceae bacterium]|nr:hypothetical protein [Gemmatimonadaceae bacterium]NUP56875.1 hypothetical protein [Gemmatimonadaceae bacterium]NUP72286.1 hypothetical protein [Gemmatimonadaceae bacterium]
MATTARPLEQTVDVETPELVLLSYSVAGVGSRVLAALTDYAICAVALIALVVALIALEPRVPSATPAGISWAAAVLILAQFAVLWGYYVLFEGLMDGQTPGKRIHRLRVVREGGFSVTFGASAVRNLVRFVDMQPVFFYLVGLGSILATRRGQRLGDLVAGTIVVREALRPPRAAAIAPSTALDASETPTLQTALSEDEFRVLDRFMERSAHLDPLRRGVLAGQLVERFATSLASDDRAPLTRLAALHQREQQARARGISSRGETGAGRERQALIAANLSRWNGFASQLAVAQKRGLRALAEDGVREFVAEYRAVAADLARLRTAAGGREVDELFHLARLVAGAHNLLYRDRRMPLRASLRFLVTDVPREVRRSAAPIALAATLLFLPALVAGVAVVRTPNLAAEMVPAGMLRRAEDGVRRARNGEGYIDDPQLFRPIMASSIVANNVQVSFAVFAGGITAGLLSALMLVANGLSLGSVTGLYVSKGIGPLLLAFVAPHGVLELFAICVAGGAGFLLAAALLVPGERTRRRALAENSRRAIRLVGASTVLLLAAGLIEGLVSPIEWWPIEGKLAVSGTTLALLVLYLRQGRARPAPSRIEPTHAELALGAVTAHRAP